MYDQVQTGKEKGVNSMAGIKILVVEDEFIVANDIRNSLEAMGYAVVGIAASGEKAIKKAKTEKPDLILMDIMLRGEMNGIEAAKEILARFNVPVVFLTAYADPLVIEQAKAAKPFGYLIKSYEDRQLKATIEIALGKFRTEEKMKYLALHDSLTGLANRNLFHDRLTHARFRAYRYQHLAALLYIDLDEFGTINKIFNQEAGDRVLMEAADRLTKSVRKTDTVARIGGDEFVVILQDVQKKDDIELVAKKIIHTISRPISFNEKECSVRASVGISVYPYDGLDNDTLRKKADSAMHKVKKSGKNSYHFCNFDDCSQGAGAPGEMKDELKHCKLMPNKEMFYDRLTYERASAYRSRSFVGMLFLKLDSFGDGRSECKTDAGVFQKVSDRLKQAVRETDTVARIDEDEFVVMLQNIQKKEEAEFVAKKIIQSVNEPFSLNNKNYKICASIGISIYPYDGLDNNTLMKKADEAIRIKKNSDNNYYFCDFSADACFED